MQYWGNVAIKMNLKVSGVTHTTGYFEQTMKNTLVLGA
jgi:hypothetical protein